MSVTYGRVHIFVFDTYEDASQRLAQRWSVNSPQFRRIMARLGSACARGYGYPAFDDNGAWVTMVPSEEFLSMLSGIEKFNGR